MRIARCYETMTVSHHLLIGVVSSNNIFSGGAKEIAMDRLISTVTGNPDMTSEISDFLLLPLQSARSVRRIYD